MKKLSVFAILMILLISCTSKEGNMTVKGNIQGLKKGTIYLQKVKDTALVIVDSVVIDGNSNFILVDNVKSPEIYYLTLDKKSDEHITFFGDKGEITIESKLDKLVYAAKIKGSKNQTLLEQHSKMIKKFTDKQLDLIKANFEAQRDRDLEMIEDISKKEKNLLKRRYLYTVNFAVTHGKSEIAPYLALTDLYYANVSLLDTINNSLSKKVKNSKYGLELQKYIDTIKKSEANK
ncbi:MAG: DUF4369 domain-containing protein [Flavobacteriaceae bacterium]|nr:DUF4369 domain-containing protein [Flavobacteriaceae bacterium]